MEPFETTLHEARRGEVAERFFPHKVSVKRLFDPKAERLVSDANEQRVELNKWLREQFGPEAVGEVLNRREAERMDGRYLDPKVARITFYPEHAWVRCNMVAWRFRDERHAVLFKLRAY
jgi:hypothetical protein